MTAILIEVKHSLLPNSARLLDSDEVLGFREAFEALPLATSPEWWNCWRCPPPPCRRSAVYQIFEVKGDEWCQYLISDDTVVRERRKGERFSLETRRVEPGTFWSLLSVAMPSSLPELLRQVTAETANPCPDPPPRPYAPPCLAPLDFDRWVGPYFRGHNNCYNFALKDLWCGDRSAYPPGPSNGDLDEWAAVLAVDGLVRVPFDGRAVPERRAVPEGRDPNKGWHVALALAPVGGVAHFLRFDADIQLWSHKYGSLLPQACDAGGNPISREGLLTANLCEYRVQAFFWAHEGIRIRST